MTNEERLADAKDRYHELLTGQSVRVLVDQNGERMEYTAANREKLAQYIQEMEATVAGKTVGPGAPLQVYM